MGQQTSRATPGVPQARPPTWQPTYHRSRHKVSHYSTQKKKRTAIKNTNPGHSNNTQDINNNAHHQGPTRDTPPNKESRYLVTAYDHKFDNKWYWISQHSTYRECINLLSRNNPIGTIYQMTHNNPAEIREVKHANTRLRK